jgi:dTDP-4-dehydrorhamnose reductase
MNILITGVNGLLGSHLLNRLGSGHRVTGICRHKPVLSIPKNTSIAIVDMATLKNLNNFLIDSEYDIIINCAAMTDVDLCERKKEEAYAVNTDAVNSLAEYCQNKGALLIQISTDYIFDGNSGPYREEDLPNPVNHYGETKLAAEKIVIDSKCAYIIARTVHVYGNMPDAPSKQIAWLLAARESGMQIQGAVDQYSNPTWAGNLADAVIELMNSNIGGMIHIGGNDYVSRYEFVLEASKLLGIDRKLIKDTTLEKLGLAAQRPLKAGLSIEKMKRLLKTPAMGIRDGLTRVQSGAR